MTTSTSATPTSLLLRLGLLVATVFAVACDAEPQDPSRERIEVCGPEDGCDGIADVQELDAAPSSSADYDSTFSANTCERDDPAMSYVADDAESCAMISVHCAPGWQYFSSGCGCGCEFTGMTDGDPQLRGGQIGPPRGPWCGRPRC